MGRFLSAYTSLFLIAVSCAPLAPQSRVAVKIVPHKNLSTGAITPQSTTPLDPDKCYFLNISADQNTIPGLPLPSSCASHPSSVALVKGFYSVGSTAEIFVPQGLNRRFDLVAYPKNLLPSGDCTPQVFTEPNTTDPTGYPLVKTDSQTLVEWSQMTLVATGTFNINFGDNLIELPRVAESGGRPYSCISSGGGGAGGGGGTSSPSNFLEVTVPSTSPISFGNWNVDNTAPSTLITLTNTHPTHTITLANTNFVLGSYLSYTMYNYPGQNGTCGTGLAPGQSCSIELQYYPYSATDGRFAGPKNFSLLVNYLDDTSSPLTLNVDFSINVQSGAFTQLCIYVPGETVSPGYCPSSMASLPNFKKHNFNFVAKDQGGNLLTSISPQTLNIKASTPGFQNISFSLPTIGTFLVPLSFRTVNDSAYVPSTNLYVGPVNGNDASRSFMIVDICSLSPEASGFQAGNGTINDPYVICTGTQMTMIDDDTAKWNSHYVLAQNVNLTAHTADIPLANGATGFGGTLKGNGYAINGLSKNDPGAPSLGLFAKLTAATITDLKIIDPNLAGGPVVGSLAGIAESGTLIENIQVIYSTAAMKISSTTANGFVGGILGQANQSQIVSSSVNLGPTAGEIRVSGAGAVGGLTGSLDGTGFLVSKSKVFGNGIIETIGSGTNSSDAPRVGGIAGHVSLSANGTVEKVFVKTATIRSTHASSLYPITGGIVGRLDSGSILDSYFAGTVAGVGTINRSYGGIVGEAYSTAIGIQRVVSIPNAIHQPGGGGYYGLIAGYSNMSTSQICPAVTGQKCIASNIISQICGTGNTPACDVNGTQLQTFPIMKSTIVALFGTTAFDFYQTSGAWMMSAAGAGYPRLRWEQAVEFGNVFSGLTLVEEGLGLDYNPITGRSVANLCKNSGKWYWEIDMISGQYDIEFGIGASTLTSVNGSNLAHNAGGLAWSIAHIAGSYSAFLGSGPDSTFGSNYSIKNSANGSSVYSSAGTTFGIAIDLDVSPRQLSIYQDGVLLLQQGNYPSGLWTISTNSSLSSGAICPTYGRNSGTSTPYYNNKAVFNFGTKTFKHSMPAGFKPYNFLE